MRVDEAWTRWWKSSAIRGGTGVWLGGGWRTWRAGAGLGSSDGRDRGGRVARKGYVPRRAEREQDEMWALIGPLPQVKARSVSAKVSAR